MRAELYEHCVFHSSDRYHDDGKKTYEKRGRDLRSRPRRLRLIVPINAVAVNSALHLSASCPPVERKPEAADGRTHEQSPRVMRS